MTYYELPVKATQSWRRLSVTKFSLHLSTWGCFY